MTGFGQRTDCRERIAVAGFQNAGKSGMDVGRKRSVLVEGLLCRRRSKLRRCRDFRLVQDSSHQGEHAPVGVSGLDLRNDVGLKIRDQFGCVHVAPIGAVAQMLEQPLQQKQITDGKRLILAGRRHVANQTRESGKDFVGGAFAVPIERIIERRRSTLGDRLRNPSRMLIRRRGFWLGSAHRGAFANHWQ